MLHFVEDWILPVPPTDHSAAAALDSAFSSSTSSDSMVAVTEETEDCSNTNLNRSPNIMEDEDYLVLSKSHILPTMDHHFQVHQG